MQIASSTSSESQPKSNEEEENVVDTENYPPSIKYIMGSEACER